MNEISSALTKALEQFFLQVPIFCQKVDAERISVLLWKGDSSQESPTYILKIANQKFLGLPRVDKNGQTYWKFKECSEEKSSDAPNLANSPASETKPSTPNKIALEELRKKYEEAKPNQVNHPNNSSELNNHESNSNSNSG